MTQGARTAARELYRQYESHSALLNFIMNIIRDMLMNFYDWQGALCGLEALLAVFLMSRTRRRYLALYHLKLNTGT